MPDCLSPTRWLWVKGKSFERVFHPKEYTCRRRRRRSCIHSGLLHSMMNLSAHKMRHTHTLVCFWKSFCAGRFHLLFCKSCAQNATKKLTKVKSFQQKGKKKAIEGRVKRKIVGVRARIINEINNCIFMQIFPSFFNFLYRSVRLCLNELAFNEPVLWMPAMCIFMKPYGAFSWKLAELFSKQLGNTLIESTCTNKTICFTVFHKTDGVSWIASPTKTA